MNKYTLPDIIEKDSDGYFAQCPSLQGCCTQGENYEEVLANIKDAIALHVQDRLERGEAIETSEMVCVATLEIAASGYNHFAYSIFGESYDIASHSGKDDRTAIGYL